MFYKIEAHDELQHAQHKYIKKKLVNGKWQYYYDTRAYDRDASRTYTRDDIHKSNQKVLNARKNPDGSMTYFHKSVNLSNATNPRVREILKAELENRYIKACVNKGHTSAFKSVNKLKNDSVKNVGKIVAAGLNVFSKFSRKKK